MINYRVSNEYNMRLCASLDVVSSSTNFMYNSCLQRLHRVGNETYSDDIFKFNNIGSFQKQICMQLFDMQ